ncbi:hypothetical protein EVJ32_10910 [Exiguobacterium sp. SH5S4]|uniref:hypothetical protein n=1 Tax=Exiguobacterium sp. SH5S4 TaxID=2510961 RepID=UPI00103EA7A0|nr:hypothetical protein [Exiguobacterium sp. SH5S4]TCI25301.1 hypothetical protein EVJ32_10910 [Exiguobacterium sp. SH5S4]
MKRSIEKQENPKSYFPYVFGGILVIAGLFLGYMLVSSIYGIIVRDADGAFKDSGWKEIDSSSIVVNDIRFGTSISRDNTISLDTEEQTLAIHAREIEYFVKTDGDTRLEIKVFDEVRNKPNWLLLDAMDNIPVKRAVRTLYVHENDTQEVSKRFADGFGWTLNFLEEPKKMNGVKEQYYSLPTKFDLSRDSIFENEVYVIDLPNITID